MSLIACVDAKNVGRFFADFGAYCRAIPPGEARPPGHQQRLIGIVLTRGPWVGELSEALEARLPSRWSMGLLGVWSVLAPMRPCDLEGLITALTELPSPHSLSMLVPVLGVGEPPRVRPSGRYRGQVLAPLLQTPSGELRPTQTPLTPNIPGVGDQSRRQ